MRHFWITRVQRSSHVWFLIFNLFFFWCPFVNLLTCLVFSDSLQFGSRCSWILTNTGCCLPTDGRTLTFYVLTAHSETFWRASAGTFLSVGCVGPSSGRISGSVNLDGGVCEDLVRDDGWIVGWEDERECESCKGWEVWRRSLDSFGSWRLAAVESWGAWRLVWGSWRVLGLLLEGWGTFGLRLLGLRAGHCSMRCTVDWKKIGYHNICH